MTICKASLRGDVTFDHVSFRYPDAKEDVQKLLSYEDDEIGSCMTNNFICIPDNLTIREAMSALVKQAGEHDNISTIYVVNSADKFAGAIDLKEDRMITLPT